MRNDVLELEGLTDLTTAEMQELNGGFNWSGLFAFAGKLIQNAPAIIKDAKTLWTDLSALWR